MAVAFQPVTSVRVASTAAVIGVPVDDTLLLRYQSVGELEGGAGRVAGLQGTVEQRGVVKVLIESRIVLAAVLAHQQVGVVGGHGDDTENLARCRFDGHDTALLALQQLFAVLLQLEVKGAPQVLAGHRRDVGLSIFVRSLLAVVHIHQHHPLPLLAAQFFLIRLLNAADADVIAQLVVVVGGELLVGHLADVAENVRRDGHGVGT